MPPTPRRVLDCSVPNSGSVPSVARPKAFDPDLAIEQAMRLFWSRGYEATSVQDLTDELGIGRASLYGTFGSKDALYDCALERYQELEGRRALGCLDGDGPARDRIRGLFEMLAREGLDDPENRGCFVLNAALERQDDPATSKRVQAGLLAFERTFEQLLSEEGVDDPQRHARFLVTALQGVRVVAKATRDEALVRDSIDVALTFLD